MFQAGTTFYEETKQLLTAGGRVLCTVAISNTIEDAQKKVYHAVKEISFCDVYYRNDIGDKAFR